MTDNPRDPSFLLGKMTDAERKAWQRIEQSRQAGATAEHLADLTRNAVDTSSRVRSLAREAYDNSCRRR